MTTRTSPLALVASNVDTADNLLSYRIGEDSGALDELDAVDGGESPSYIAVHPSEDVAYLINGTTESTAVAFSVDRDSGALSVLNRRPTGGEGACYCSVDATGSVLLVAHYHGGVVSMLPIQSDGTLGDPVDVVEHEGTSVVPDWQDQAHPHAIVPGPDNQFAYVPDLGADRVVVYRIDFEDERLRPADPPWTSVQEGAGPRHLTFHPDGRHAYLINQLDATLTTFERDAETGALERAGTVDTLPGDFTEENHASDVHVHPSGRFVYATNRGHDSIAVGAIDPDEGTVRITDRESTRGEWPRTFALDPEGSLLFAANLHTDGIVAFAIDGETGWLSATGDVTEVASPKCVTTVPGTSG